LLLYLSHGLRETAYPGVAALHACCRLYKTVSLRFLTMGTLVPHAHSTLSSASVGKYFDLFMHEIYYKAWLLDGGKVRRAVALVVGHHRRCGHRQEDSMNQYAIRRWVFVSLLGGMFVLGFVSGSVSQRPAQAQVPGMGGALGSAKELGSSIVEMQQHVDGLQKNLATLKKVEAALGGGK
jgi:hypothetical protein